jgi:hypothetical protein
LPLQLLNILWWLLAAAVEQQLAALAVRGALERHQVLL